MFSRFGRAVIRLLRLLGGAIGGSAAARNMRLIVVEQAMPVPDVDPQLQPEVADIRALRDAARGSAVAEIRRLDRALQSSAGARLRARVEGDRRAVVRPVVAAALPHADAPRTGRSLAEILIWRSWQQTQSRTGDRVRF